jgi:phosphoglycerate dehydrogenase-like enzyme
LIGEPELDLLPDGAILVNVARGAVVNEKPLYERLKVGKLSAGLDVWYNYPRRGEPRTGVQPSQFPFHELDNVVMTPHVSGNADSIEPIRARDLARLIHAAERGKKIPNRVDLKLGY